MITSNLHSSIIRSKGLKIAYGWSHVRTCTCVKLLGASSFVDGTHIKTGIGSDISGFLRVRGDVCGHFCVYVWGNVYCSTNCICDVCGFSWIGLFLILCIFLLLFILLPLIPFQVTTSLPSVTFTWSIVMFFAVSANIVAGWIFVLFVTIPFFPSFLAGNNKSCIMWFLVW